MERDQDREREGRGGREERRARRKIAVRESVVGDRERESERKRKEAGRRNVLIKKV